MKKISNVCKPDIDLSGMSMHINNANVNAPIIIAGDYHRILTNQNDDEEILQSVKPQMKPNESNETRKNDKNINDEKEMFKSVKNKKKRRNQMRKGN